MPRPYIDATQEAGKAFYQRQIPGPIVLLNLLRFREVADYSHHPGLAPPQPISGREAYQLYMTEVLPLLKQAGSEVLFSGRGGNLLIGPPEAVWDLVLLVQHQSVKKFLEFAADQAYLRIAGHRTAALEDSRLLPIKETALDMI